MQNWIKILCCTILFAGFTTMAIGQKYGHMNSGNLLAEMSEMKTADAQLVKYQEDMATKGQEMVKSLETFVMQTREKINELSPVQVQAKEQEIQKRQGEIAAYEKEMIGKVQEKRVELLEPILSRVNQAIEDVAKENGYAMIFDTSVFNAVVFAEESVDITDLVKAKLGM